MADVLARNLTGGDASFAGFQMSARLKLLGTDVATFGDPLQDALPTRVIHLEDQVRGTYKKLVLSADRRQLLGGILVGEASAYSALLHLTRSKAELTESLEELALQPGVQGAPCDLPDGAQLCSCNNVLAGTVRGAIREKALTTIAQVKACTRGRAAAAACPPSPTCCTWS